MTTQTDKVGLVVRPPDPGDTCDKACPAVAMVRVELLLHDLLFCGHHFDEVRDQLSSQMFGYYDSREEQTNG